MPSEYHYNTVDKYIVWARLLQPLRVGNAGDARESVLIHPVTGDAFVQASSIAGACRSYCKERDAKAAVLLFGPDREEGESWGRLKFTDGILTDTMDKDRRPPKLELRPHVRIQAETGSVSSAVIKGADRIGGHTFSLEYVGAGAFLNFSVYLSGQKAEPDYAKERLLEIFAGVRQQEIRIGGKKSNGCGQLQIKKLLHKNFDLTKEDGRKEWAAEEQLPDNAYTDIADALPQVSGGRAAYKVVMTGKSGSLLVKCAAIEGCGEDVPDTMNIQNTARDYIIPGSSFKGVLRSRMEQIADYLSVRYPKNREKYDLLLKETFGATGEREKSGTAGNLYFADTVVGNRSENDLAVLQRRIHIDKFTGGVMSGSLFSQKNASGRLIFAVEILNRAASPQACALLVLALRDLALGQVSVGSGYGIGKGFIEADSLKITKIDGQKTAEIDLKSKRIRDEDHVLADCLSALRGDSE